jgi:hypothetical protein
VWWRLAASGGVKMHQNRRDKNVWAFSGSFGKQQGDSQSFSPFFQK